MTKNNDTKQALEQQQQQENAAAIARLPEFKTLDLTDDPEQVKGLIQQIDAQANKEIAQFVGAIEDQRFVLVGRCFIHLKSITDKGKYQESIEELGYTYDQVKKQVKVTETYINHALKRKKGIDALLGPGMLGTMGRLFNRSELAALGDGKKVLGLRDSDLQEMSQSDVINHVRAARAERDEAIQERSDTAEKLKKSNKKNQDLEDKLHQKNNEYNLLEKGPESLEQARELCANIRSHSNAIKQHIVALSAMAHSAEVAHAADESVAYAKYNIQISHDEFHGAKSDAKKAKELERLRKLFGYKEEE